MEEKYMSFLPTTKIPYLIISKLATSENVKAENLWKLLKYTTSDSLSQPNLTFEEKMDLVWTPDKMTSTTTQDSFNVFLKPLIADALNTDNSQTQLRITRYKTTAITPNEAMLMFEFNVVVNEGACMVYDENNDLIEKTDLMEAYLIDLLNMIDLGIGINFLRFSRMQYGQCESILNINNSKSLYGRSFLLALRYFDKSLGGACS